MRWIDAFAPDVAWMDPATLPDEIPDEAWVTSVGYLIKQTNEGVWLASGKCEYTGRVTRPEFIPQTMIQQVEEENV